MGAISEAFQRALSFFHRQERDSDFDAEVQSHIDLAVEENISHGMPPDEARRRALVRFGGVQQAKEQQRGARGLPWLEVLLQDLRYTFRTLRRDSSFASAMSSASSTIRVASVVAIDQPTMRRLQASSTTARYRKPAQVGM